MTSYIKQEFKRAVFSFNTILAIVICTVAIYINFINTMVQEYMVNKNAVSCFMLIYRGNIDIVIFILASLIVSLPYASSYAIDKNSGFLNNIHIRLNEKKYFIIRYLVNGIVGGGVLAICLTVTLLILLVIFRGTPITPIPTIDDGQYLVTGAFSYYYNNKPLIFAVICILMSFAYGFIFATLGFAVAVFTENSYLAVVVPFIFPILVTMIFSPTRLDKYISAETLFFPLRFTSTTSLQYIFSTLGWLIFVTTLLVIAYIRKGKKNA